MKAMKKRIFTAFFFFLAAIVHAQNQQANNKPATAMGRDSMDIKEQLVNLAIQNSSYQIDDANIQIAEYNLRKAKNSWFNNIGVTGNINEFAVTNSTVASYYPKYNLGVTIPLGLFSTHSNDVKIATKVVEINALQKTEKEKALRREVLTRFENFLERKDNLKIENETVQEVQTTYIKAKNDYSASLTTIDKMTTAFREYNDELQKQRTAERNYNVAYIELEELVGFRLRDVLIQFGYITN
jgi:outer membrane protein TolC